MAFLPTNASQVQQFAVALYGIQVGSATMAAVQQDIVVAGGLNNALNAYYAVSFGSSTTTAVGTSVAANLGLTGTAATDAAAYITAVLNGTPANARGAAIEGVLNLFSTLTANATFGAAATAWNTKVAAAVAYTGSTDAAAGSTVAGTVFTLGTGIDTITTGTGSDTYNGYVNYTAAGNITSVGANSTFTNNDTIADPAGNNTLNLIVDGAMDNGGAAVALPVPTVTGVQTLNIRNVTTAPVAAADILTVDAASLAGVTTFAADRSTREVDFTNLPAGSTLQMSGNGSVTTGAVAGTYKTTVTAPSVALTGGTSGGAVAVTAAAATSLAVSSTGGANSIGALTAPASAKTIAITATTGLTTTGITAAGATSITAAGAASTGITGSKAAVELGTLPATVTTVDASGLTAGGIAATLVAAVTSLKGGSGNDNITTIGGGTALTSATASIDGGAGVNTLTVNAASDIANATEGAKYTNFQALSIGAFSQDASVVPGITAIKLAGAASSVTNLSAAQAASITVTASDAAGTIGLKDASGTADVVNLTGSTTTAGTAVSVTALVITGVETLNYTNSATAASTLSFAGAGSTGLKTLTVAGAKGVTLDVAASGTPAHATTLTSIDASGLTAQATGTNTFTLQDTVGSHALKNGLVVTGSAGDDVIGLATDTMAAGVVATINGGAGNDNITASLGQLYTAGSGYLTINGGDNGTAGDTLTISDTTPGTISDSAFAHVTGIETLALSNTGTTSLTTGGFFNTAFGSALKVTTGAHTSNALTFDGSLYTGAVTLTDTATTGVDTITTGSGADKITLTSSGLLAGSVIVNTGAGNDTIAVTNSAASTGTATTEITAGPGTDKITVTGTAHATAASIAKFNFATGDSTVGGADTITGFYVTGSTRLSDTLNLPGTAIKPAAAIASTAVTGNALADLAFSVTTDGLLAFTGTKAAALTAAQVESIWSSQVSALLNTTETVVWADANTADSQNGNSLVFNHATAGDTEVILVGVQATAVGAAAATANLVGIA